MKQLLILLAALCAGHAEEKDLSGKVFTFPVQSATSSVQLIANVEQPLTVLTMCMRFFSSLTRAQSLFSLDIPSQSNAFLLFKLSVGVYRLHVNGATLKISGLGLTALWVNEKRSPRAIMGAKVSLTGVPSIILGQDQDTYGGGFDQSQSFVGEISDVHMWDKVISPCEIRFYMDGSGFTPGNLLNWKNLRFSTTGTVYEEQSDFNKLSCF
uniref:C-reactive protein-like n=1 Tax=Labrus bergylta TaxID=56723 RepID=A0A3Q3EXN7_9LABR